MGESRREKPDSFNYYKGGKKKSPQKLDEGKRDD